MASPSFPLREPIRTHRIPSFLPTWSDNHLISRGCYQSREGGTNQEHFKREATLIIITAVALLTDTLESGQLYLHSPSQNPVFLNSHKNSVFLHPRKRPALVTDTFFVFRECPLMRASTVNNNDEEMCKRKLLENVIPNV